MAKSLVLIKDELKMLKEDMFSSGDKVDLMMLASYVDRLSNSVSDLAEAMESMEAEMECACECCSMEEMPAKMPMKKPAMKKSKKPTKKPAKKKRK